MRKLYIAYAEGHRDAALRARVSNRSQGWHVILQDPVNALSTTWRTRIHTAMVSATDCMFFCSLEDMQRAPDLQFQLGLATGLRKVAIWYLPLADRNRDIERAFDLVTIRYADPASALVDDGNGAASAKDMALV